MSTRIVIDNSQGGIENDGAEITLPINPQEGAVPIASSASSYVTHLAAQTMRNRIINGAMNISQRYSDRPFQPAGGEYTTDRWIGSNGLTYSGYFDGSGDYLTAGSTNEAAFDFGTGDFTVETWFYTSSGSAQTIVGLAVPGGAVQESNIPWYLDYQPSSGGLRFTIVNGSTPYRITTATPAQNVWHHVAVSRSSGTVRLFLNGALQATSSIAVANNTPAGRRLSVGYLSLTASEYFTGYISNLRIVKGTALYTSNFTPSTIPLTAIANTSLLTCASSTFLDKSSNAFTVTANGNAAVNTLNPFPNLFRVGRSAGWSNYFDGSGDYLSALSSTAYDFGTGDFTIEMWVNPSELRIQRMVTYADQTGAVSGTSVAWKLESAGGDNSGLQFNFFSGLTSYNVATSGFTAQVGTWFHVAVTRQSGSMNIFVNGVLRGTASGSASINAPANRTLRVANYGLVSSDFYGYISNLRIVKGTALYTTNFTPSTMPLVPVANTSLLTCGSETFQDKSSNNFAITAVGNAAVTSQSPFTVAPTGFTAGLQWSVLTPASASASDVAILVQAIEGTSVYDFAWGTAGAKDVTLSFWVRSPVAGTYCASLRNGAVTHCYIAEYSVLSANTWEKKVITIPGATVGTWVTNNNLSIQLRFDLGSGTNYSGVAGSWQAGNFTRTTNQTNFVGTALASGVQSNNFLITGVQLEAGSAATPFEFRPMQAELALCQRYYARLGSLSGNYVGFGNGGAANTASADVLTIFPVPMRAAPQISASATCLYDTTNRAASITGVTATNLSAKLQISASGLTTGRAVVWCGNNDSNAYVDLNSEL